ncbi:MAG TPA: hypothetical protein VGE50_07955 [Gammaproteobacteria bacterium]
METKFHLLAIGQHFEWEGKRYVKTTPLLASEPEGGQKFMPRAALVQVTGELPTQQPPGPAAMLDAARVRAAIERYHQQARQLCDSSGQRKLEQAYQILLGALNL